ncbi:MAG: hypothetical protein RLZZ568_1680 [Cyanobacteriota bacterium]
MPLRKVLLTFKNNFLTFPQTFFTWILYGYFHKNSSPPRDHTGGTQKLLSINQAENYPPLTHHHSRVDVDRR